MKYFIKKTATHCYKVWVFVLLLSLAIPFSVFSQEPSPEKITSCDTIAATDFDPTKLTTDAPFSVRFLPGSGKYAFDAGREPWYQTSQLIKDYYRPLDNGYIAPWKLVPAGQSDVVEAFIDGSGGDKKKIKFVLKDGKGVPAHEENGKWTLTLPSVKAGETYELLAVYEEKKNKTQLVGKLNVVSYAKQKQTVTLVPVKGSVPDTDWLETELNRIYSTYGVSITIKVDDALKGNTEWDIDGDSALNLNGSGFFSKETDEMKALRKLYQRTSPRYDRNAYYIFLTERAKAGNEPDVDLAVQGDMPRGKQFGYIFMQNAPNTPRLIAHELGHGIFTLRHTFEVNYSGDKFKSATTNLMDYNNGSELTVWQWNVMANPAPLTWFDSEEDGFMKINDKDCWDGKKITWTTNTAQLYKGKKALKYDAASSCMIGANSRVYYRLVNEDIFRETTLYTTTGEIDKIEYAYFLKQFGCWIPVTIDMFETDCLSCELNKLFKFIFYKEEQNIFFDKNFVEPDITGVGTISYTYTLDYDIKYPEGWEKNVPLINRPKTEVHATGTITDERINSDGEDKYVITIRVPKYNFYSKLTEYTEYTYEGKLLKPLGVTKNWKQKQSLGSAALEGLLAGFNAGLGECISAELAIGTSKLIQARKLQSVVTENKIIKTFTTNIDDKIKVIGREPLFKDYDKTFLNSEYVTSELLDDIITYRRFGGEAKVGGVFVSTTEKLSRDELALVKDFNNSMRFEAKIRVPKGEKINIGKVGPWPIKAPEFMGGADQIILRYGYPQNIWVVSVKDLKTGKVYTYGSFKDAFPNLCK